MVPPKLLTSLLPQFLAIALEPSWRSQPPVTGPSFVTKNMESGSMFSSMSSSVARSCFNSLSSNRLPAERSCTVASKYEPALRAHAGHTALLVCSSTSCWSSKSWPSILPETSMWSRLVLSSMNWTENLTSTCFARSSATRFSRMRRSAMASGSISDQRPLTSKESHLAQRDCWIVSGILESVVRCLRQSSHILSEVSGGGAPQAMQKAPADMILPTSARPLRFKGSRREKRPNSVAFLG